MVVAVRAVRTETGTVKIRKSCPRHQCPDKQLQSPLNSGRSRRARAGGRVQNADGVLVVSRFEHRDELAMPG